MSHQQQASREPTDRKQYIEQAWQSYRKILVESGAGEVQIKETRQAFFSGASVLFTIMTQGMSPEEEPTDSDMKIMSDIAEELHEFGEALDRAYFGAMPPMPPYSV